ncbi:MAG: hypothetical protein DMF80_04060 [Acidobacteria bacterium]|nr:MAG: hypothetical protein DMF80_04060 [Acidobacteriota bacterium]PYQ25045.1 MAG: hypothetical protein DMF81_03645 [Acidobacteriota bacterium]
MAEYFVVYKKDGRGWRAGVRGYRRARARGRTIRVTRVRLRRALALLVQDPDDMDFVEDVRLPGAARRLLGRHWASRRRLAGAQARADAAAGAALQALKDLSLGIRDASDLLGVPPLKLARLWKTRASDRLA